MKPVVLQRILANFLSHKRVPPTQIEGTIISKSLTSGGWIMFSNFTIESTVQTK